MGNVHTAGPNETLVISGGCRDVRSTIIGGWGWAWWCVSNVQKISLEVMTLHPRCEDVETSQGVRITVTGVAQVKIITSKGMLDIACEQFMSKKVNEIKIAVNQTLDGHLRAILGTLTVESIYRDRDTFADRVREVASPDLGRMGMEIISFTIKDVMDQVDYLDSLGRTQTAAVKRDAKIGVAEANRDAGIREAVSEKEAMDVKYSTDSKVADNFRGYEMQQAVFNTEVNRAKAEAQLAYHLQSAKQQQLIRQEEVQIEVVERRKQIAVESKEIERKEKELFGTVRLPAEAEAFRIQCIAEGQRTKKIEEARAAAERVKMIGEAEASAIEAVGKAEALRMQLRAQAYQAYGNAAVTEMVVQSLPKIAAEIAAPLEKVGQVVIVGGGDRTTTELAKLAASLPPTVQALTGVDLQKFVTQAIASK